MTVNVQAAFENDPPALDFVWPGFLAGTVGALVAPGGAGKSFWALEAAMAVAGGDAPGSDLLGLGPSRAGRVVYFAGEDPAPILDCRIHAIGRHLSDTARSAIAGRMTVEPVAGSSMNVTDRHTLHQLVEKCSGARLVVLDTLSRMHRLDENSNGDMAVVVACLERLALEKGSIRLVPAPRQQGQRTRGGYRSPGSRARCVGACRQCPVVRVHCTHDFGGGRTPWGRTQGCATYRRGAPQAFRPLWGLQAELRKRAAGPLVFAGRPWRAPAGSVVGFGADRPQKGGASCTSLS